MSGLEDSRTTSIVDRLMNDFASLSTPSKLIIAGRVICESLDRNIATYRFTKMFQASIAAVKIEPYVDLLAELTSERLRLAAAIADISDQIVYLKERDSSSDIGALETQMHKVANRMEINLAQIANTNCHISNFSQIFASGCGYKLSNPSEAELEYFRPLRNFFEHFNDRVNRSKQKPRNTQLVIRNEDDVTWFTLDTSHPTDPDLRVVDGIEVEVTLESSQRPLLAWLTIQECALKSLHQTLRNELEVRSLGELEEIQFEEEPLVEYPDSDKSG